MQKIKLLSSALLFTLSINAYTWGPKGHAVMGRLDFHLLSESVRRNVQNNIGAMSYNTVANWMDAGQTKSTTL